MCLDDFDYRLEEYLSPHYVKSEFSNYIERSNSTRYSKLFSVKTPAKNDYCDFIKTQYNSDTNELSVDPIDVMTLGFPMDIKTYSDISLSAEAIYQNSLDSKGVPLSFPIEINPTEITEINFLSLTEFLDDFEFGIDYKFDSLSGSLSFQDHMDLSIDDSSTVDERKKYYTQLYNKN